MDKQDEVFMQGHQSYQPRLFVYMDLESLIPSHHFLRKIDEFLDLSFIRALSALHYSEGKGRPSIDPEIFFRMILVNYFYGIRSDRRLCEEVTYNLAYRWFCRLSLEDKVPDHSSFTRIRDRLGEEIFRKFFNYVLHLCEKHGLLKGESIIMDSTLVEANASLDSLIAIDEEQERIERDSLLERSPIDPMPTRKISNATHKSVTDPDASLARKNGSPQALKYKVHHCVDAYARIIVDTQVTTGKIHDSQGCLEKIHKLKEVFGFNIKEVIADRGYGSSEIISALTQSEIKTYIPLFSGKSGTNLGNGSQGFLYEENDDRFRCPEGKYLLPKGKVQQNLQTYYTSPKDCRPCSSYEICKASKKKTSYARFMRRNIHQPLYDRVLADMQNPVFKEKLIERRWKIEGLFAEAKENHCLRRAKYRGRAKMQIQAYLVATVQNLKRLVREVFSLFLAVFSMRRITILTFIYKNPQAHPLS